MNTNRPTTSAATGAPDTYPPVQFDYLKSKSAEFKSLIGIAIDAIVFYAANYGISATGVVPYPKARHVVLFAIADSANKLAFSYWLNDYLISKNVPPGRFGKETITAVTYLVFALLYESIVLKKGSFFKSFLNNAIRAATGLGGNYVVDKFITPAEFE
jgi:hypothetical protein